MNAKKHNTKNMLECRKRDFIIRIANWIKNKDEPGYDVEIYIGGIYQATMSKGFYLSSGFTPKQAKNEAIKFSQKQIKEL